MRHLGPLPDLCQDTGKERKQKIQKGRRTKKWTGWRPRTEEQKIEFKKKEMEDGEDSDDEDLVTIQRTLEIAAGNVAHHTKAERENMQTHT